MRCCANCFGDRGLTKNIIPSLSSETGTCGYCSSSNVHLVEPGHLAEYFTLLISIYNPDPAGRLLVEWLKHDWKMFEHPRMDIPGAKSLLADVLNDGEIVRSLFSPSPRYQSDRLDRWVQLRNELLYENRYFPTRKLTRKDSDNCSTISPQTRCLRRGTEPAFNQGKTNIQSLKWARHQSVWHRTGAPILRAYRISISIQRSAARFRNCGPIPASLPQLLLFNYRSHSKRSIFATPGSSFHHFCSRMKTR
jgi:hypothetical protein